MARYKRSYGMRRFARRSRRASKWTNMLLRNGNGTFGLLGDYKLDEGARMAMFGPSFKQRLLNPALGPQTARQMLARRAFRYYGDGDYTTGPQYGLVNFGSGSLRGNKITGVGDYSATPPAANQLVEGSVETPISVNSSPDLTGDVYFSHREFVGNVTASATNSTAASATVPSKFSNAVYAINPGMALTFPWLSQVANNFTMYDFMGCIFEYRPTSGEFGAIGSSALGKIVMATQYDPDANPFTSSTTMENYDYAIAGKPCNRLIHGVETKRTQGALNMLYTRSSDIARDKIFTDIGTFQLATEGVPMTVAANSTATAIIGELWVSYKVKLSRAQIQAAGSSSGTTDFFIGGTAAGSPGALIMFGNSKNYVNNNATLKEYYDASAVDGTGGNGTLLAPKKTNTMGITISTISGTIYKIQFPPSISSGQFLVEIINIGQNSTDLASVLPTYVLNNCALCATEGALGDLTYGLPGYSQTPPIAVAGIGGQSSTYLLNITGPSATITITNVGVVNTMNFRTDVIIVRLPLNTIA